MSAARFTILRFLAQTPLVPWGVRKAAVEKLPELWKTITPTFTIEGRSIVFHPCGVRSYNPNDRAAHYCGRCHRFVKAAS